MGKSFDGLPEGMKLYRNTSGICIGMRQEVDKKPHVLSRKLIVNPDDVVMMDKDEERIYNMYILSGGLTELEEDEAREYLADSVKQMKEQTLLKRHNKRELPKTSEIDKIIRGTIAEVKEVIDNTEDLMLLKTLLQRERVTKNGGRKGVVSVLSEKIKSMSAGIIVTQIGG